MLRLLVVAFTLGVLSAAPDTVQILEEPPPEEVSDQIRPALSNRLYKVELKGNSTAEFWFRDEMPVREGSQGDLGVNFGLFKRGALLGIVRLSSQWKDYRGSAVKDRGGFRSDPPGPLQPALQGGIERQLHCRVLVQRRDARQRRVAGCASTGMRGG